MQLHSLLHEIPASRPRIHLADQVLSHRHIATQTHIHIHSHTYSHHSHAHTPTHPHTHTHTHIGSRFENAARPTCGRPPCRGASHAGGAHAALRTATTPPRRWRRRRQAPFEREQRDFRGDDDSTGVEDAAAGAYGRKLREREGQRRRQLHGDGEGSGRAPPSCANCEYGYEGNDGSTDVE